MKFELKLKPHQLEFVNADDKFVMNSGGVGSGKSFSLVAKGLRYGIEYPRSYGIIGAATFAQLRYTTYKEFLTVVPPELIKNHNKSIHEITLFNGSVVHFLGFSDEGKLRSINAGWIGIEEASTLKESVFNQLRNRLRGYGPRTIFGATNPDTFTNHIYKNFIQEPLSNSRIIFSKTTDNTNLPDDYISDLNSLEQSNPEYYKRMVLGEWGNLEGLIYKIPIANRIDSIDHKYTDSIIAGVDFGYQHPTAVVVLARQQEKWIQFAELYERAMDSNQIIEACIRLKKEHKIETFYCDNARPEIISQMVSADLNAIAVTKGAGSVFEGILTLQGIINQGNFYILKECSSTIREFDSYVWDSKQNDKPIKLNDDAMDAVRYAVMSLVDKGASAYNLGNLG